MALIIIIDAIVIAALMGTAVAKGFEKTLPLFAFIVTLMPGESTIFLPGFFQLSTQRVAIVALAILCFTVGNKKGAVKKPATPLRYLILLILGWSLISAANSIVFTISLKAVLSNVLDFYLLYYIITRSLTDVQSVHKMLTGVVAALAVCCVLGYIEIYFHWKVADLFPIILHRFTPGEGGLMLTEGRVRSTFPHAILFANALALGIPIALYLLTIARNRSQRIWLWIALALMFWNIYKTLSRGPWLALLASFCLLLFLSTALIRKYLAVIAILTLAVLLIRPGVWDTLQNIYFETIDSDSLRGSSYQYRYTLMRATREVLDKDVGRTLWGYGPDSFYYLGLEGINPNTGNIVAYDSCDSAIVEVMVDTGYVGLLLVIALMLRAMLISVRGFTRLPMSQALLSLIVFVDLVAYVFMMMSVMNFGWGQQSYILWVLLAVCMVYENLARSEALAEENEHRDQGATTESVIPLPIDRWNHVPLAQ